MMGSMRSRKYKETDEVKIPQHPSANQFRAWKNLVFQALNACSGRPDDKAIAWLLETETEGKEQTDFRESGFRFPTLDRKLAMAFQKKRLENWVVA